MEEQDLIYRKAKKKVKQKKGFYGHLSAYISVLAFFLAMNLLTWDGELWFFFPMLPWGIGLLIHYFSIFGLPGTQAMSDKWEEEEIQKEIRRLRGVRGPAGDFPKEKEEGLELKELQKEKQARSNWEEDDLV